MAARQASTCERKLQEISRELNSLQDENRNTRCRALETISSSTVGSKPELDCYTLHEVLLRIYKPLLRAFNDPVEKCREVSVYLIRDFWKCDQKASEILPFLMPTLVQRLGQHDITEQSEEIRLILVELLHSIIDRLEEGMAPYLNDLVKILRMTIIDPYPEVKKESCKCASQLAAHTKRYFHQQSESLVVSLLKTLSHQHAKVRVQCIRTLGDVVQYGNNKSIDDVVPHLSLRIFDFSPVVRLAVSEVIGRWLVELPDRYSYFYRLIPLLLSGLSDDVPENQKVAEELWLKAGAQFENENEEDFKDKLDYPEPEPIHYPPNVRRPNLGCRQLVSRNFSKILPALINDLDDWVVATRLKACHLLYALLLNGEDEVTQQINHILNALCRVCRENQEASVLTQTKLCAELLGYFIKPKVYCELILENTRVSPTAGILMVLAALIRGTNPTELKLHLQEICVAISKSEVCEDSRLFYQLQLLAVVKSITKVARKDVLPVSMQLFRITLTVYALATEEYIRNEADTVFMDLARVQELDGIQQLFQKHLKALLEMLVPSQESWIAMSPERYILDAILCLAGPALGEHLDILIPMLTANLRTDKDPQVRLRFFISLSNVMLHPDKNLDSANDFDRFVVAMVESMILPNVVWHAGKTAAALRTAAVSCLWALLDGGKVSAEKMSPCLDKMLTDLLTVLEDDVMKTRLSTCRVLEHVFNLCVGRFNMMRLHDIYPHLMKRLDDANNQVRISATRMFRAYFKAFDGNYEPHLYRAHLEDTYGGLLLHLDDPDSNVQDAVFELLKEAGEICPQLLHCKTEDARCTHRSTTYCDELLRYLDELKIQSTENLKPS